MTESHDRRRPLWRQVLDDLERRLSSGEIAERFPTDRELVEQYGVSRHTVREAVRHLKARGVVERARGRGSQVTGAEFVQPLGGLYSLFAAVEQQGRTQTSEVLALGTTTDPHAAKRLELAPTDELFVLDRIRLADGEPLALDTAWLPLDLGAALVDVDFGRTALYDVLESRTGVRPDRGEETIAPVLPDDDLRASLDLDEGEAVLRLERRSWHRDRPIECRITLVRGGRFAFLSTWPSGGSLTAELDRG